LEQSAGRARVRGGVAATAALLERSAALTTDPSLNRKRLLACAAAHFDAGSLERAIGVLAIAEATALDGMEQAQVDMLRGRASLLRGDVAAASAPLMRAAKRLESIDLGRAFATHLAALGATVLADADDGTTAVRDAATATLACRRSPDPTTPELL